MLNSYIGYRGGVFFMNGDYHIVRQKARAQPPHTHDFIEIVYIHSGRGTHIIDGVQYPVKHGDILFINFKSNHRAFSEREMIYTNILIKPETIDGSLRGNENAFSILSIHDFAEFEHALNKDNCHISFSGEERNLVESLINLMEAENGKTAPGSNLIVHSALNILLPLIFRKMSLPMKDAFGINAELLLYIKDNCSSNITLESIAHRCFYTPAYFSRAFKKFTGVTFTEYLTQCRIDKAKSFLTDTDMPIEAIIAEVGYSNRTKFFSAFKESTGTTPYRYKKAKYKYFYKTKSALLFDACKWYTICSVKKELIFMVERKPNMKKKYDIAAYVYPAYTGDELRARMFWPEGNGEWQTVKDAEANALVHKPEWYETWKKRKPLWGYVNEANPDVMQMQIECAVNHGVNVFIYDWYWYDNRPYIENCLNDGFLKASNNGKMKFYIMWANHDVAHAWDIRSSSDIAQEVIWQGTVDRQQFEVIGKRWIEQYFTKENYYCIDGKPVVSIYALKNFVTGLGGVKQAMDALEWLRKEAAKAGLPGVHVQFIRWSGRAENLSGVDNNVMETGAALIEKLGFDSLTHYQFCHFANVNRDYNEIIPDVVREWDKIDKEYHIPYYPHVSVGWDNNPRWTILRASITKNNTPENFELALRKAKEYVDTHNLPAPLITINSWNEWTETSYLEPDALNGYGYLEAVKRVFVDET